MTRRYLGCVQECIEVRGRCVVVCLDRALDDFPGGFKLGVGDELELKLPNDQVIKTCIHAFPYPPSKSLAFALPPEIAKDDLSLGTEVWLA